jgi:hypothetical protein
MTLALAGVLPLSADLAAVQAERNLERRAKKALDNAGAQLDLASRMYSAGGLTAANPALEELLASVQIAKDSLDSSVKNPRNSAIYKDLEVRTRALMKRLGTLVDRMAFQEREQMKALVDNLRGIHDETLRAVMTGRKK